jgi:hypothetical protein
MLGPDLSGILSSGSVVQGVLRVKAVFINETGDDNRLSDDVL